MMGPWVISAKCPPSHVNCSGVRRRRESSLRCGQLECGDHEEKALVLSSALTELTQAPSELPALIMLLSGVNTKF